MADPKANDKQGYHQFIGETSVVRNDGEGGSDYMTVETHEHGSFEVFWDDEDMAGDVARNYDSEGKAVNPGWYWWACFPGYLPDGEATGPFATSQEAYDNAQEGA